MNAHTHLSPSHIVIRNARAKAKTHGQLFGPCVLSRIVRNKEKTHGHTPKCMGLPEKRTALAWTVRCRCKSST